jgi:hypothetical protein
MDGEYFSRLTYKAKLHFSDMPIANFRKRQISMAGENSNHWDETVKQAILYDKILSYNRLKIAEFIPYSIGNQIRYYYLLKRFVKKLLRLDYFRIHISKNIYKDKHRERVR